MDQRKLEMKKLDYTKEVLSSLKELLKHANGNLLMHIVLACSEYPQLEYVSDKEFSYLLDRYISMLEIGELSLPPEHIDDGYDPYYTDDYE